MTTTLNRQEARWLSTAETAKLLRAQLKREFPGVQFSVRSDNYAGGSSIRVHWTNGPTYDKVDAIARNYAYGGFDGMIDMQYSYRTWILPDATLMRAGTSGTVSSMGVVSPWEAEKPEGAEPIHAGATFVSCSRNYDQASYNAELQKVTDAYGVSENEYRDPRGDNPLPDQCMSARSAALTALSKRDLPAGKYLAWNKKGTF